MMKPIKDNIYLVEVERPTETASGIILTGDSQTGVKPGKIVAIGPDVHTVRVGDEVYVKWPESMPVTYKGERGAIIAEKFVLAVL